MERDNGICPVSSQARHGSGASIIILVQENKIELRMVTRQHVIIPGNNNLLLPGKY